MYCKSKKLLKFVAAGVAAGAVTFFGLRALFKPSTSYLTSGGLGPDGKVYAMAAGRFALQKKSKSVRALQIEKVFNPEELKGKRVLVTGTSRGLGLAIVKVAAACGAEVIATCRKPSADLETVEGIDIIEGIDVTSDDDMQRLVGAITAPVDILVNNAGYFKTECEKITAVTKEQAMDFDDQVKTIDICSVGVLRVTTALYQAKLLLEGSKMAVISSQGGSLAWRSVQCPEGGDYGHHMSKAAANMAGVLAANELKSKGIAVAILHPGFNRTDMTRKYSHVWDIEGAVDASVGAYRVLHEINLTNIDNTGRYINCEDGLSIPF